MLVSSGRVFFSGNRKSKIFKGEKVRDNKNRLVICKLF